MTNPNAPENETSGNETPKNDEQSVVKTTSDDVVEPVELEFEDNAEKADAWFKMMQARAATQPDPNSIEALTQKNTELNDAVKTLAESLKTAEANKDEADQKLIAAKKTASDAIVEVEKQAAEKGKQNIAAFLDELKSFAESYESAITGVPADERTANINFDKIVRGFELNLTKLQAVFNKFSPKPAEATPAAANNDAVTAEASDAAVSAAETPAAVVEKTVDQLKAENNTLDVKRSELLSAIEKAQQATIAINRQITAVENEAAAAIERTKTAAETKQKYAIMPVIKDILPVIDTYERGTATISDTSGTAGKLLSDLQQSFDKLAAIFNTNGVVAIAPKPHDVVDENRHQVIAPSEEDGFADGVVVKLEQKGYEMQGRVIRPAAVFATPD